MTHYQLRNRPKLSQNSIIFVENGTKTSPFCLIVSTENDKISMKPITFKGDKIILHDQILLENSMKYTLEVVKFDLTNRIDVLQLKNSMLEKKCSITQNIRIFWFDKSLCLNNT